MRCGLCHKHVPKLVRSHVIAKAISLYGRLKESQDPLVILPSDKTQRPVRSRTGVYSEIVCSKCEAGFQAGDDALTALCRTLHQGTVLMHDGEGRGVVVYPDANIHAVHRGVLTAAFRAHLSPHPMFKHVSLEKAHEDCIRALLLSDGSTLHPDYGVVLRVVTSDEGQVVASPFSETIAGAKAIRFYFPGLTAYVKMDKRPYDHPFSTMVIGATPRLQAILQDQLSPAEMDFFRHVTDGCDEDLARYGSRPRIK